MTTNPMPNPTVPSNRKMLIFRNASATLMMFAFSLILSSCHSQSQEISGDMDDPFPMLIPFPLDKAGYAIERDFEVAPTQKNPGHPHYFIGIRITYHSDNDPRDLLLQEINPSFQIVVTQIDDTGDTLKMPLKNHSIRANDNGEQDLSNNIAHLFPFRHPLSNEPQTMEYVIAYLDRPQYGHYHVSVETREDHAELANIRSELIIDRYISGK